MSDKIKRPSILLFLSEIFRALIEWIRSRQFRLTFIPKVVGDGHPVLVIPGFLGTDPLMKPMRKYLKRINYFPYPWGLGRNMADARKIDVLEKKLDTIFQKHQEKVSIIGWSLGGIYGRELAKRKPDLIRQVITIGAPFGGIDKPNNAMWVLKILVGKITVVWDKEWIKTIPEPTPVLTTSIYSKKDGVVSWQYCIDKKEDARHRNLEATSSHAGMPYDWSVLKIVAECLPGK